MTNLLDVDYTKLEERLIARRLYQPATITEVRIRLEHETIPSCTVMLEFDDGHRDRFGDLALYDGLQTAFVEDLCKVFGVANAEALCGQQCHALRSFVDDNALVDGLESDATKRRFLLSQWRRANCPKAIVEDPLVERKRNIEAEIARHERAIRMLQQNLQHIQQTFFDWERSTGFPQATPSNNPVMICACGTRFAETSVGVCSQCQLDGKV